MPESDVIVVGGGIVGLATALALQRRHPDQRLVLVEKEPRLAQHQTGHNSGVMHSGLYYRPGSLKARLCVLGAQRMVEFCQAQGVPYRITGKVVVATTPEEVPRLQTLYDRGVANGVKGLRLIGPEQLREFEPAACGIQALHVPGTGVVDYAAVAEAMRRVFEEQGGCVLTDCRVARLQDDGGSWIVETTRGALRARTLVTCGGLWSDQLAGLAGAERDIQIVPFRGEYYDLVPERRALVRSMIYPVPDPAFPFLGVHFTRTIADEVHAGPNAVLALKREGYRKQDVEFAELIRLARFPGLWRLVARYGTVGIGEWYRSISKAAFVRALQRLVPAIQARDLVPGSCGVRAQALDRHGHLLDDFEIHQRPRAIHVRNVPSPAATASLGIGDVIAEMATSSSSAPAAMAQACQAIDSVTQV